MTYLTRFAPSPTGPLHAGHALAAAEAFGAARRAGGTCLLRIEDIDFTRCRPEYVAGIFDDLRWLGFDWPEPVLLQSTRTDAYRAALSVLEAQGLLYPCFCSRSEIARTAGGQGHDGPLYAGTCRSIPAAEAAARRARGEPAALRLRLDEALALAGAPEWTDALAGPQAWDGTGFGDVVIARRDIGVSYHLAVTVDDAFQEITEVVRGADLFQATHIHVLLQRLLGLSTPFFRHHPLVRGGDGDKLSKSRMSKPLAEWRADGVSADEVLRHVAEVAILPRRD
ncbi:MAG: tRNA glutamyl-Q(34) synthetase GluQRS [Pseudomonadota bacterium]|nr:tRNA glutamyl-Q(34) synthetase GluQRS [Pseudomonadota bacterium]